MRDGDPVARLIRLAGHREPPEPERAARVRSALHAHWGEVVRARRRTRRIWYLSAAAAAAASIAVWILLPTAVDQPSAPSSPAGLSFHVASVVGAVSVLPLQPAAGSGPAVETGSVLPSGRTLRANERVSAGQTITTGADGRIALDADSGPALRLDVDTSLRLLPGSGVALDRGTLYLDTGPLGSMSGHDVTIETPFGRIHHVGTQLEARVRDGTLRVRVREGAARLEGEGSEHLVPRGSQLEVDEAGNLTTAPVEVSGPEWIWLEAVTPMPEVDGRTLRSLLDWVVRERGWRLGFAGAETERAADRILLSGSVEGLTIDQGLDAVLPTCGMGRRLEGDLLVIEKAPSEAGEAH